MKKVNYIFKVCAVAVTAVVMALSCGKAEPEGNEGTGSGGTKPEEETPNFPSLVEDNNVAPGSELTLTFTPNYDWEISVPTEVREWFWLKDGSFTKTELKGKASESAVTVKVGVTENQDFDKNYSCEVTMKMNSQSKVIARYMLPAKERTLSVYAAKVENGAYVTDETGGYEYETAEATSLDLIWSESDADFRMPVKVVSNSEWTSDIPQWMSVDEPESTVGSIEMVFTGSSIDAAEGEVRFMIGETAFKTLPASVPACGEVALYSTVLDDNGEFSFGEGGGYLYTDEPVEALTLVWPGSDFRMPVKVEAKCNWTLECPEWLYPRYSEDTPENKAGTVMFTLMGDPMHYPLEDETEKIVFKFLGETVHQIDVTIPGVADKFSYGIDMALTEWEFNSDSHLMTSVGYQDMSATAWFLGTKDSEVVAVEMADGKRVADNPEWVTMDVQAFVSGAEVLQQRTVTVRPEKNASKERHAYVLFCASAYDPEDYFNGDGTLKEDMARYAVSLTQYGADMDYITMISTDSDMETAGLTFKESTNPRLVTYFGETDHVYELTYNNVYAIDAGRMSLARPYASVKVFNAARKEQNSDFWLQFEAEDDTKTGGVVTMYKDMTPSESLSEGYVVFYDETGATLAIVYCRFDPVVVVDEVVVEFTEMAAQYAQMTGATLEHLTEGDIFDHYSEGMNVVYHLTYKSEGMPLKIRIPSSVRKHNVNPYAYRSFFRVNDVIYDEYFGPSDILGEVALDDEGAVEIYMNRPDSVSQPDGITLPENVYMASVNFLDKSDAIVFVLVCTLDLSE